jgi:hypothetical protein
VKQGVSEWMVKNVSGMKAGDARHGEGMGDGKLGNALDT